MSISALASDTSGSTTTTTGTTKNDVASQDRFLKLLVAQMQNQDPLNPMDNAQVTSQMAQINTVTGIDKLNTTVQGLNTQFVQMQALQGASLVGRDVIVAGNRLSTNEDGLTQGGFELDGAADSVQVEILDGAGRVIDKIDLGAESTGRHGFEWTPKAPLKAESGATFRVTAKSGATAVPTTLLMRDRVDAVSMSGDTLSLQLRNAGSVNYGDIKAFN